MQKIKNMIRRMVLVMEGYACSRCGTWIADGGSCPNPKCG